MPTCDKTSPQIQVSVHRTCQSHWCQAQATDPHGRQHFGGVGGLRAAPPWVRAGSWPEQGSPLGWLWKCCLQPVRPMLLSVFDRAGCCADDAHSSASAAAQAPWQTGAAWRGPAAPRAPQDAASLRGAARDPLPPISRLQDWALILTHSAAPSPLSCSEVSEQGGPTSAPVSPPFSHAQAAEGLLAGLAPCAACLPLVWLSDCHRKGGKCTEWNQNKKEKKKKEEGKIFAKWEI